MASSAEVDQGNTVDLSPAEEREVAERTSVRAQVVFESVRREGEVEINRSPVALAFSALAAGLSMGFSLVVPGLVRASLPDVPWRPLLENLGYTVGFLIVVLGRQQLFTENTVTAILPLLDRPSNLGKVARLWAVVLAGNLIGAAIFAFVAAHTGAFEPNVKRALLELARQAAAPAFGTLLLRGIFAGWLIALMVWLLPAAEAGRVFVILIITYVVGALGLSHIVAGSVEVLYAVASGQIGWTAFFGHFFVPVVAGNAIGGVLLVALLNYGQVAAEGEQPQAKGAERGNSSPPSS